MTSNLALNIDHSTPQMLKGKTALVTGASSGIGRATAKVLSEHGANVVIAARRADLCAEVAEDIRNDGGEATWVQTDVTENSDVQRMLGHTLDTYGKIDCAFNNAGVLLDTGRIHEMNRGRAPRARGRSTF